MKSGRQSKYGYDSGTSKPESDRLPISNQQLENKPKSILSLLLKSFGVTLFALLLSLLLATPFNASLSGIFSVPERGDFRMTDFYYQLANSRAVRQYDDRIVLIDIGLADREHIAEGLEILSLCEPLAVGLDVNFAYPGDNDSLLMESIAMNPGIVLPLVLEDDGSDKFRIAEKPYFYDSIPGVHYGAVNLPAEKEGALIREFTVDYPLADEAVKVRGKDTSNSIPSFAMAIAGGVDSVAVKECYNRNKQHQFIDYVSREFKIIPIDEIADRAEELTEKYVIVGAMNESGDMHATPIHSYMSGMLIHAYSLSTILDGKFIRTMPRWIDFAIAIILCTVIIFIANRFTGKAKGFTIRVLQFIFLFAVVWIGYSLFLDNYLICNFSHSILMLAFGLFALDIWNGADWLISSGIKRFKTLNKND